MFAAENRLPSAPKTKITVQRELCAVGALSENNFTNAPKGCLFAAKFFGVTSGAIRLITWKRFLKVI